MCISCIQNLCFPQDFGIIILLYQSVVFKNYISCYTLLGFITGHKAVGMLLRLEDGASHSVDSSELAFRLAARGAVRTAFLQVKFLNCHPLSQKILLLILVVKFIPALYTSF